VNPLITVDELVVERPNVTILDVRYRIGGPAGPSEFGAGHVPDAVYVDVDTDLAAPPGRGGRHPLPDPTTFSQAMQRLGVSNDRPVVAYDDWGSRAAARAWWLLRYFGHPNVRVLDGGWDAWKRSGQPISRDTAPPVIPGSFEAVPGGMPIVEASDVMTVGVLIDARAPERFRGEIEPIDPVAGHIPGAVNVPTNANLDASGRFRAPAELAAEYARVGAIAGADVAAYCGSGVTAAHDVLALELANIRAKLYPGSWSGWITDPSRPIARGE
jgi:thiosulfate/3-mercaptopyruvate sulfurtransferase